MRLRVASYNVRSFRGGADLAVEALGPAPDVILIQECGPRRAARRFARALGRELVSTHRPFGRVRNAVAYPGAWRALGVEAVTLSNRRGTHARGFVALHAGVGPYRLTLVSAHLGLAPSEREEHARELTDWMAGVDGAVILGADLNEGPDGTAARWIGERLFDAHTAAGDGAGHTFPAEEPSARIDYVFVGEGARVLSARVMDLPSSRTASDHRPVMADVEIDPPAGAP